MKKESEIKLLDPERCGNENLKKKPESLSRTIGIFTLKFRGAFYRLQNCSYVVHFCQAQVSFLFRLFEKVSEYIRGEDLRRKRRRRRCKMDQL